MKNPNFSNRTIRAFLLWRFLPLLLISVAFITCWSITGSWLGASFGGEQWVSSFSSHYLSEINEIQEEAELAQITAEHALEPNHISLLPKNYISLKLSPNSYEVVSGDFKPKEPSDLIRDQLQQIQRAGLYEIGDDLAFVVPFHPSQDPEQTDRYFLLKILDHHFADRLAVAMGTEVTFILTKPTLHVSATSWKNMSNETYIPSIDSEALKHIEKIKVGEVYTGKGHYHVPSYRGLVQHYRKEKAYNRGDTDFDVFHAFTPIKDENGNQIGYFSVMVPEDVLLQGVKSNMILSSILGLIIMIFSTWFIIWVSKRFVDPLTNLTEEVNLIARILNGKYAKYGVEPTEPSASQTPNEITSLTLSVRLLKQEVIRAERIEKLIEDERARTQFASKMAALGEMSASVAHEVNNPISVIHALSDELYEKAEKGKATAEETKNLSLAIKETATRVAGIVRALLRLSRDANDDVMELHSLKNIIDDAVILVNDQLLKSHIKLTISEIPSTLKILCRGTQISQVILNLLNNAIDAAEESADKWIHIEVTETESSIIVAVSDSGPGISEKIKDRIMEPFVTTKPPGKGTGLGLSLSKHIIEEHHGKLILDADSLNTRFLMELPLGAIQMPITSLEEATHIRSNE